VRWRRGGHVYAPDGSRSWARQHAFPPTPVALGDERIRVYVAFCDERMVGRAGFVDVLADSPGEVVRVSDEPVLDVGEPGCFDDNGVVPVCVVPVGGELWMYYTGYELAAHVPYHQFLGLAISRDGGESFTRHSRAPVLDRSHAETQTRASAHVIRAGDGFRMYYAAGDGWTESGGRPVPVYDVRVLDSADGTTWGPEGRVCIPLAGDDEHALARPWIVAGSEPQRMLYSVRTRSAGDYRLGTAVSHDGLTWERRDHEAGLGVAPSGWDSQAVAYPAVHRHGERVYLFYCGNQRGLTGFGYAELESW
jgi:hypothetical protein